MAKVSFVEKARKDYPNSGIKKGESYYYWKFRFGPLIRSKFRPRPSQLTQSVFMSTILGIQETLEDLTLNDDLQSGIDNAKEELENLRDETQEKYDNMPSQLQDADTGQLLLERIDGAEEMISALEAINTDIPDEPDRNDIRLEVEKNYPKPLNSTDEELSSIENDIRKEVEQKVTDSLKEIANRKEEILQEIQGINYSGS